MGLVSIEYARQSRFHTRASLITGIKVVPMEAGPAYLIVIYKCVRLNFESD